MKKFCLTFVLIMSMLSYFGFAIADDTTTSNTTTSVSSDATEGTSATLDLSTLIAKLPCLNQAILYSWESNSVKYAMSFTVISLFNDKVNLDAMYVPSSEIGGLVSFKLFNLGDWVKFPLLEYIEFQPFAYVGMKNIGSGSDLLSSDLDYGAGAKIISIKF